jgi:hypothetical protein
MLVMASRTAGRPRGRRRGARPESGAPRGSAPAALRLRVLKALVAHRRSDPRHRRQVPLAVLRVPRHHRLHGGALLSFSRALVVR